MRKLKFERNEVTKSCSMDTNFGDGVGSKKIEERRAKLIEFPGEKNPRVHDPNRASSSSESLDIRTVFTSRRHPTFVVVSVVETLSLFWS